MKSLFNIILLIAGLLIPAVCISSTTTTTTNVNPACPDAQVLSGKLITDISWNTVFPLRIAGAPMGGGEMPEEAAPGRAVCTCQDSNGVYHPGTQISLWEPARLIEVVPVAGCAPTLGGSRLQNDLTELLIGGSMGQEKDLSDLSFYNVNYYAFPLMIMLDLLTNIQCKSDGYMDVDLMYASFTDPTWNDDELAFFLNPEVIVFASPLAQAACLADVAASAVGRPIQALPWCAGEWGLLYPFTGFVNADISPVRDTSLLATRFVAALHRRGMALKTMGEDVMCRSKLFPTIPKSQYKMSMFYPVPEVEGSVTIGDTGNREMTGSHWIGQSTYLWGEWRNIPGKESYLYVLWRWSDCCATKTPN